MLGSNDDLNYLKTGFQLWKEQREQRNEKSHQERQSSEVWSQHTGDPLRHYGYSLMKSEFRSDFKLTWNKDEFLVHKCALASESQYFQALFQSEWRETNTAELRLSDRETSREGFQVFLVFLYTSLIRHAHLKRFIPDLYFLSDYFQVKTLKSLGLKTVRDSLNIENAVSYLSLIVGSEDSALKCDFCDFIASNYISLSNTDFPFHKVGKNMLFLIFRRMATSYHPPYWISTNNEQLGVNFGDPSHHEFYAVYNENKFTDITLIFKGHSYASHKFIIFLRSPYFRANVSRDSQYHTVLDVSENCTQEAFNVFLVTLYTGMVRKEMFTNFSVQLFELSVIYRVKSLRKFCLQEIQKNSLTLITVEELLMIVHLEKENEEPMLEFAEFVAHNYRPLVEMNFSFHKVGQRILLIIFKELARMKPVSQGLHVPR
jgi:hypothetical protein